MKILIVFLAKKKKTKIVIKKKNGSYLKRINHIFLKNEKYHNFNIFIKEKN
jgi:hypothetical protein